jgi:hypothetical protein
LEKFSFDLVGQSGLSTSLRPCVDPPEKLRRNGRRIGLVFGDACNG